MVKAYAEANGFTVQWARRQRAQNTGGWQSFLAARAGGLRAYGQQPAAAQEPLDELDRARYSKDAAWQTLQQATATAASYKGGDVATMAALNRAMREARRTYEDAAKYEKAQAIEAVRWVPIGKVEQLKTALPRLSEVVQNFRTTIAGQMPAEMRPAFYKAFDACRPAWNEGVRRVDDYIKTLLPARI